MIDVREATCGSKAGATVATAATEGGRRTTDALRTREPYGQTYGLTASEDTQKHLPEGEALYRTGAIYRGRDRLDLSTYRRADDFLFRKALVLMSVRWVG